MYRTHWGLREIPFRGGVDGRFFYESPAHEEALARLHYLVAERRRLGLVLGIDGGGKSLLLEVFARQIGRRGAQVAQLSLLGVDAHELLWCVAADLGANPERTASEFQLWRMITDCLVANRMHGVATVLLLDDVDEADPLVMETLARMIELERGANAAVTFILAATQGQLRRLTPRLIAQAELRINLDAWEESDTANYLFNSLRHAGRQETPFNTAAVRRLHQLCGGVPRRITQLANLALLAGAGRNIQRIDADTIENAWHELGLAEVA